MQRALLAAGGDVSRAAADLGWSRRTLYRLITEHGVRLSDYRPAVEAEKIGA